MGRIREENRCCPPKHWKDKQFIMMPDEKWNINLLKFVFLLEGII
jgi:hypothetical protein